MNKLELIKNAATLLSSAGVALVVKNAISATTPIGIGRTGKISVAIGTAVVSGLLADKAGARVNEKIDDLFSGINASKQLVEKVKEAAGEAKEAFVEAKEKLEASDEDLIDPANVTKEQADAIVASVERKPGESANAYQRRVGAKANEQKEKKA